MSYNFSSFKTKIQDIKDWLSREYSGVRTGRATPALLDNVRVDAYGSKSPINQVASLSIEDPKTLRVSPWDSSQIKGIERAVMDADLGVSVVTDDKGLRIIFPELTSERRGMLIKIAKEKLEQARTSLRQERQVIISNIQDQQKSGSMSEDEAARAKDEAQKLVDGGNSDFEAAFAKKETEINQ